MDKKEKLKKIHELENKISDLKSFESHIENSHKRNNPFSIENANGYEKTIPKEVIPISVSDLLEMIKLKTKVTIQSLTEELESLIA